MSAPRRDPRNPARNRRDPRMDRRDRRDPRGERTAARPAAPESIGAIRKAVRIPEPACWVLIVPDRAGGQLGRHDRDAFGAARRLADSQGGAVVALVFADGLEEGAALAPELGAAGADRVVVFDAGAPAESTGAPAEPTGAAAESTGAPEARAAFVLTAIHALNARHVVLPDTPHAGGDLGRRVAARLGELPATHVVEVAAESVVCRGDGGLSDFWRAPPRVVLVAPEAAEPVTETLHEAAAMIAPAFVPPPARILDLGPLPVDPGSVPLAEAGLVLSAGAGVRDWAGFHALAAALGAAEGGSRVVCDAGALPRDRQVGASGTVISARGYLALGISGAPQHLDGIAACDCVIAVNQDPHADIVSRADLAVIGDVQQVMPALLRALESRTRGDA